MANDRVLIRCDPCGSWSCMFKYSPVDGKTVVPRIFPWLAAHTESCHKGAAVDLAGAPGFSFFTEDDIGETLAPDLQNAVIPDKEKLLAGARFTVGSKSYGFS